MTPCRRGSLGEQARWGGCQAIKVAWGGCQAISLPLLQAPGRWLCSAARRWPGERQCRREGVPARATVPCRGLPAVGGWCWAPRWHCSGSPGCTSYLEAARKGGGCGVEAFLPVPRTLRGRMQAPTLGDPGAICAGCEALKVPLPSVTGSREKRGLLLPSTQRHHVSAGRPAHAAGKAMLLLTSKTSQDGVRVWAPCDFSVLYWSN